MKCEKSIERVCARGVAIEVFVVPWDTEIFGFPVAQIESISVEPGSDPIPALKAIGAWLRKNDIRLASCRLRSDRLHESMLLEAGGFRFVEMVYSPTLTTLPAMIGSDPDLVIEEARPEDLSAIEAVAGSAFSTGRFLLDWRLDEAASHHRYRVWVQNSFADPRHQLLKATLKDSLVGFFILEERPESAVYWHLTAISPAWQGRGLGSRVWRKMVARHHAGGVQRIDTTISAHNTPVMNIYASLGFRFALPQSTFHWVHP